MAKEGILNLKSLKEQVYEYLREQLQKGEGVVASPEERRRQQILDGRGQADPHPHPPPRQHEDPDAALDDPNRVGSDPSGDPGDSRHQRCHVRRRER